MSDDSYPLSTVAPQALWCTSMSHGMLYASFESSDRTFGKVVPRTIRYSLILLYMVLGTNLSPLAMHSFRGIVRFHGLRDANLLNEVHELVGNIFLGHHWVQAVIPMSIGKNLSSQITSDGLEVVKLLAYLALSRSQGVAQTRLSGGL